ncbi:hypothetical protein N4P33_04015 [Streptomyces sp. 15-116A]|uniref:hypothetical protein n=1 Tax=Streptomyces sp. 15-116A TaxID=2259035 RepID=UPI0021B1E5AB|nr:hypothetical protein [Streptomyces sp. 15-116A]MCT7351334.1 hypothetical protein [Streptomyces sp. 15-116A]
MAARRTSRRPFAWTEKDFPDDVFQDKRRFGAALQEICRHFVIRSADGAPLTHPTQAQAAGYLNVSESALTRYLRGQHVPPRATALLIFETACRDAGGEQNLPVTREKLLELHAKAEQERCGNCSRHREAERVAQERLRALQENQERLERAAAEDAAELRELRRQATVLKREAQLARTIKPVAQPGSRAGSRKVAMSARAATLLPVPRRRRDRQLSKNERSAARHIALRAEELLHGGRPDSTLALLRHTAEAYTPVELATLITVLRMREQHKLADNLVHIYGRDRTDHDVVQAALLLHEHEAAKDAESLLRTAAAHPGPATSQTRLSG